MLAGAVAKTVAGPAVTLSFLVAAIASAFAGEYIILRSDQAGRTTPSLCLRLFRYSSIFSLGTT